MEAKDQKFGEAGIEALESGLSPEKKEKFEEILGKAEIDHYSFGHLRTQEEFLSHWKRVTPATKEELLEARKLWNEMKSAGSDFRGFFEDKFEKAADSGESGRVYCYLFIYKSLNFEDSALFLGDIIDKEQVWTQQDGSNVHRILDFLKDAKNPETADTIIRFINNALSDKYGRKKWLDLDLHYAALALTAVLGNKSAREVLQKTAESDKTFAGWFEKKKLSLFCQSEFEFEEEGDYTEKTQKSAGKFDERTEEELIKKLEENLNDDYDKLQREQFEFDDEEDKETNEEDEETFEEWETSGLNKKTSGYEHEIGLLEKNASRWEEGKLINFYGRFTPKIKDALVVNQENYLSGLLAANLSGKQEDYFNFLCGVIPKEFAGTKIPEDINSEFAYGTTALAYSRALCLSVLEGKHEEAVNEIEILKTFISSQIKDNKEQGESDFLRFLVSQLDEAATQINANKETAPKRLPESAESFFIYYHKNKKTRQIPDYSALLSEKIRWILSQDLFYNNQNIKLNKPESLPVSGGPSFRRIKNITNFYSENIDLYKDVEEKDVPFYWEAKEKLEDLGLKRMVVFGRDGKYFFKAIKANDFGFGEKELKYVVVTRNIQRQERREEIAEYLRQNGITLDFSFIDTGFRGSIPEFAIWCLANAGGVELNSEDVDKKIKLLSSDTRGRGELSKKRIYGSERANMVSKIEDRPQDIDSPRVFTVDKRGKLKPEARPFSVSEQLKAWTVEHAVMRNFAPKLNAEKRIEYLKKNPLEGYEFLQDFQGNCLGTHPLELWKNEFGAKVLLKGGPDHTLRADFVGQRFLAQAQIFTPKSELIYKDGELKLKMDFLENFKEGGLELPEEYHNNTDIQKGLLIDALLGQYDRTPWNIMFDKKGNVAFIDNGAGLFSRARGGYKGFSDHFDINQLEEILANPQFPGKPVNEAYANLLEIKEGKIIVKNKPLLNEMFDNLESIPDDFIDAVIEQAGFADGPRSVKELNERMNTLESQADKLISGSNDYKKTRGAVEYCRKAIEAGGEASYLKKAIMNRREDLKRLFSSGLVM